MPPARVLVLGFGNPGRLDDGLGPAVADAIAQLHISGVSVDSDYQLTVEDAADAAANEVVVFVDAAAQGPEPFEFRAVEPGTAAPGFSAHSVEPEDVLALARDAFRSGPRGYVLAIRGYAFDEFGERLSEKAVHNLAAALRFLEGLLRSGKFEEAAANDGTRA